MPRPNILWIVTTQWRGSACGFAGDPNARTPRLDELAAGGRAYQHAVSPHPFGPFARAALLTGVFSPQNGVRDYFDPLPSGARTVAHDLAARGYTTAFFGKWHLARRDPATALVGEGHARTYVPPAERGGFAFWEGFESGFLLNDPWLHGTRLQEPRKFVGYQSDVVCERAADWLKEKGSERSDPAQPSRAEPSKVGGGVASPKTAVMPGGGVRRVGTPEGQTRAAPWFCMVSLEAPHPPYDAPLPQGVLRPDPSTIVLRANVPPSGFVEQQARRELAGYYGHIEATDRAIGGLLDAVGNDAIVVVTSVHGDMHGSHGLFRKGWPYEESVRVPLIVRMPPAGSSKLSSPLNDEEGISLVDLRIMAIAWAEQGSREEEEQKGRAGIPEPEKPAVPGVQLISMPSVVALPHQCDRVWQGIRTRGRKLVLNGDGTPWLFFNLESDPFEMRNLVKESGATLEIESMRDLLRKAAS